MIFFFELYFPKSALQMQNCAFCRFSPAAQKKEADSMIHTRTDIHRQFKHTHTHTHFIHTPLSPCTSRAFQESKSSLINWNFM